MNKYIDIEGFCEKCKQRVVVTQTEYCIHGGIGNPRLPTNLTYECSNADACQNEHNCMPFHTCPKFFIKKD